MLVIWLKCLYVCHTKVLADIAMTFWTLSVHVYRMSKMNARVLFRESVFFSILASVIDIMINVTVLTQKSRERFKVDFKM